MPLPRFSWVLPLLVVQVWRGAGQTSVPTSVAGAVEDEELPKEAAEVVSGMVKGFLGGSDIPEEELKCLTKNIGNYAKDVVDVAGRCVELLEQVILPKAQDLHHAPSETNFDVVVKLKKEILELIALQGKLADKCAKEHTMNVLNTAKKHIQDVKFIGRRIMANGASIVSELSDSIISFRKKKFEQFGKDIGLMWRKVLLAKASQDTIQPTPKMVQDMSVGLVEGFFGPNTILTISSDVPANTPPPVAVAPGVPAAVPPPQYLNMRIDLHQCVSQNMQFFQAIWSTLYLFFAQVQKDHPTDEDKNAWQGSLGLMMLSLPEALNKCHVTAQQSEMLLNSIKALKFNLDIGNPASDVSLDMEKAVRDWTSKKWNAFGKDIGRLIQQLILQVFPQEYALDNSRNLKKITGLSGSSHFRSPGGTPSSRVVSNVLLASLAVGCLSLVVAFKAWRVNTVMARHPCGPGAREGSSFVNTVEHEDDDSAADGDMVQGLLEISQSVRANEGAE